MMLRTLAKIALVACTLTPAAFAQQQTPPAPQQPTISEQQEPKANEQQPPVIAQPETAPAPGPWTPPDRSRKPKMRVC
jgi:glucose/arabinose dehydrogenase